MAKASAGTNVIIAHMNTILMVKTIGLNIVIPFKELVILTYIMRRIQQLRQQPTLQLLRLLRIATSGCLQVDTSHRHQT